MNRLQFATILSWAGDDGIDGRKRLQKVVFMLQHVGCDLNCKYILHHFGPYSLDVADVCDQMVAVNLVEEIPPVGAIGSYKYKLKPPTSQLLASANDDETLTSFKDKGKQLLAEKLWNLELGSTVIFFFQRGNDWEESLRKACGFKKVDPRDDDSYSAFKFAKSFATAVTI